MNWSTRLSYIKRGAKEDLRRLKGLFRKKKPCYFVYVKQNYGSNKGKFIKSPLSFSTFNQAKAEARNIYKVWGKLTYVKKGMC
jgi:hypothetical protein